MSDVTSPAGNGEANDGKSQLAGLLERTADLLANDRPHRAHHEVGVHEEQRADMPAYGATPADDGIVLVRRRVRRFELLGVSRKLQEVRRPKAGVPLLEAPGVDGRAHASPARQAEVLAAAWAHLEVLAERPLVNGTAATRALDEHVARGELGADLGHGPLERVQGMADPIAQH